MSFITANRAIGLAAFGTFVLVGTLTNYAFHYKLTKKLNQKFALQDQLAFCFLKPPCIFKSLIRESNYYFYIRAMSACEGRKLLKSLKDCMLNCSNLTIKENIKYTLN